MSNVIAILCSDIHLSLTPPVARSAEPDWLKAQQRQLDQLAELQRKHGDVPIICAGDLFDRWNAPAELINWAIRRLPPRFYSIAGQHDLPSHRYEDIKRSAYWTLVEANVVQHLSNSGRLDSFYVYPTNWGQEVLPLENQPPNYLNLAVIHAYCWKHKHGYLGAPDDARAANWWQRLEGYNVAHFGDNHIHFQIDSNTHCGTIINTGTLMRRKLDERNYQPRVGLLHTDGAVSTHALDCSEDKFIDIEPLAPLFESTTGAEDFLEGLRGLSAENITYRDAIQRWLQQHKVSTAAQRLIEETLG